MRLAVSQALPKLIDAHDGLNILQGFWWLRIISASCCVTGVIHKKNAHERNKFVFLLGDTINRIGSAFPLGLLPDLERAKGPGVGAASTQRNTESATDPTACEDSHHASPAALRRDSSARASTTSQGSNTLTRSDQPGATTEGDSEEASSGSGAGESEPAGPRSASAKSQSGYDSEEDQPHFLPPPMPSPSPEGLQDVNPSPDTRATGPVIPEATSEEALEAMLSTHMLGALATTYGSCAASTAFLHAFSRVLPRAQELMQSSQPPRHAEAAKALIGRASAVLMMLEGRGARLL